MKLGIVKRMVERWFVRRAVETVKSWSGAASNYKDTDAYCKACLIDVNPAGKAKAQSHCMLPVKAPGSSAMADKAIYAVAGGRGLSAVKKPSDVDKAVWDKAVTKAAKTVVGAYKDLGKEAPAAILKMAGVARSVSVDSIFSQLQSALWEDTEMWGGGQNEYGYLVTVYIDKGELYALFAKSGLYTRSLLTLADNDVITMGTPEDVSQQFVPTQRSSVSVKRQDDGSVRIFLIAGTALLNRVGQIDSTALFDDMIQRADDYKYYPTIDFFHLGEMMPEMEFGQVDFLAREGVCYLASGTLDPKHFLTEAMLRSAADAWGASIEYFPLTESMDYITLGDLEVPVYRQGLNMRISVLPEANAAAWFTNIGMEKREMNKQQEAALLKLLGEDEFKKRMGQVTKVNEVVDKHKLIFRAADATPDAVTDTPDAETPETETVPTDDTPAAETPATEVPVTVTPSMLEVDEDVINALAEAVAQTPAATENASILHLLTEELEKFKTVLADVATKLGKIEPAIARSETRIAKLEAEDDEHVQVLNQDMPRRIADPKMRMTYRPRINRAVAIGEYDEEEDSSVAATETLQRLPVIDGF